MLLCLLPAPVADTPNTSRLHENKVDPSSEVSPAAAQKVEAVTPASGNGRAYKWRELSDKRCPCGRGFIPVGGKRCRCCSREMARQARLERPEIKIPKEFENLRNVLRHELTINAATRQQFEQRFGRGRTVTVVPHPNHCYTAKVRVIVIGFVPGNNCLVHPENDPTALFYVPFDAMERDDRLPATRPIVPPIEHEVLDSYTLKALVYGTDIARKHADPVEAVKRLKATRPPVPKDW
jgi:hypothetical protein